jgi:hypothetical protein
MQAGDNDPRTGQWCNKHFAVREEMAKNRIHSAPALYSAILALLGCSDLNMDDLDQSSINAIKQAQDALAKAEGRQ